MEGPAVELNTVFQILQSGEGVIGKTRGIGGRIPGIGGKDGGNAEGERDGKGQYKQGRFFEFHNSANPFFHTVDAEGAAKRHGLITKLSHTEQGKGVKGFCVRPQGSERGLITAQLHIPVSEGVKDPDGGIKPMNTQAGGKEEFQKPVQPPDVDGFMGKDAAQGRYVLQGKIDRQEDHGSENAVSQGRVDLVREPDADTGMPFCPKPQKGRISVGSPPEPPPPTEEGDCEPGPQQERARNPENSPEGDGGQIFHRRGVRQNRWSCGRRQDHHRRPCGNRFRLDSKGFEEGIDAPGGGQGDRNQEPEDRAPPDNHTSVLGQAEPQEHSDKNEDGSAGADFQKAHESISSTKARSRAICSAERFPWFRREANRRSGAPSKSFPIKALVSSAWMSSLLTRA